MNNIYLVTGCCGFIGSNMCEFLLKNKKTVIGIDNLLTGRLENIKNLKKTKDSVSLSLMFALQLKLIIKLIEFFILLPQQAQKIT